MRALSCAVGPIGKRAVKYLSQRSSCCTVTSTTDSSSSCPTTKEAATSLRPAPTANSATASPRSPRHDAKTRDHLTGLEGNRKPTWPSGNVRRASRTRPTSPNSTKRSSGFTKRLAAASGMRTGSPENSCGATSAPVRASSPMNGTRENARDRSTGTGTCSTPELGARSRTASSLRRGRAAPAHRTSGQFPKALRSSLRLRWRVHRKGGSTCDLACSHRLRPPVSRPWH